MALISHIRGLGWLYVIYGAITCTIAVVLLITQPLGERPTVSYWQIVGQSLILLGPLRIVAGWALLKLRWWSRPLIMFAAVIGLVEIPLGTLLGIYSFFVIFNRKFSATLRDYDPRE